MAYAHLLPVPDTPSVLRRLSGKLLPFCTPSAWLDITLCGKSLADTRSHLALLLHSPLGVYVTRTGEQKNSIHVRIEIAPEDFDFALHALLHAVPEATVSYLRPRINAKVN